MAPQPDFIQIGTEMLVYYQHLGSIRILPPGNAAPEQVAHLYFGESECCCASIPATAIDVGELRRQGFKRIDTLCPNCPLLTVVTTYIKVSEVVGVMVDHQEMIRRVTTRSIVKFRVSTQCYHGLYTVNEFHNLLR